MCSPFYVYIGLYRVHQFTKVEMFAITEGTVEQSDAMLESLRQHQVLAVQCSQSQQSICFSCPLPTKQMAAKFRIILIIL